MYVAAPATGKINTGTAPFFGTAADAAPAMPSSASRSRTPRADVVRWRLIKLRVTLEGADPTRQIGDSPGRTYRLRGVIEWLMRFRLVLVGALAAACATAGSAGAALNPQHAG